MQFSSGVLANYHESNANLTTVIVSKAVSAVKASAPLIVIAERGQGKQDDDVVR